jgi:hypothetical protein
VTSTVHDDGGACADVVTAMITARIAFTTTRLIVRILHRVEFLDFPKAAFKLDSPHECRFVLTSFFTTHAN